MMTQVVQPTIGMTDEQLEAACKSKRGLVYLANWTSEVYSFGKCFREISNYPRIFPLFLYSDHGAGLHSNLYPHEVNNKARVHMTWHLLKAQRYKNFEGRKFIHVPHPWILYRKKKELKRAENPVGTVAFFTHHVPGIKWQGHDTEEYFEYLKKLPKKYQPVVLCMHMHDINAGHHKELRKYGLPIVTAGNAYSPNFVDEFYNLIESFAYGTSQDWGSQLAYCVELGIPYFLTGSSTQKLININHNEMPVGVVDRYIDKFHEEYAKKAELLFSTRVDAVSPEQLKFVESVLGLDSGLSANNVSHIIWREFFNSWKRWYLIPIGIGVSVLSMIGLLEPLKTIIKKT
jgi:hypothetical protein